MNLQERMRNLARKLDKGLLPFMGPAQIGAGHPEFASENASDALCPICGIKMTDHKIIRSDGSSQATRLICP